MTNKEQADQLREALDTSFEFAEDVANSLPNNKNAQAEWIVSKAAQAHLKLLDGIEGLRRELPEKTGNPLRYETLRVAIVNHNHALDSVMKLME